MINISIIDRKTGSKSAASTESFDLNGSKVVVVQASRADISLIERQGNALVIKLKSGEVVTINDFFTNYDGVGNELVIDDQGQGGLWWVEQPWNGTEWSQIDTIDPLMLAQESSSGIEPWMLWAGAGAALLGTGAAVAGSSGGGSSHNGVVNVPKATSPIIEVNNGNELAGKADPGSTITLTKPDGSTQTVVTDGDGKWSFEPNPLGDGESGTVISKDTNGNTSNIVNTGPADLVAEDPVVNTNNTTELSGTSEPGSTIILVRPDGSKEGTVADADGNWSFKPNPLDNGDAGTVTATDPAGNISNSVDTGAADTVAPDAPIVDSNNGAGLTGTGEAGSTITLTKPDGSEETTEVAPDGSWSFAPNPLTDGEEGTVTATDPSGNTSGETNTGTADVTAPDVPVVESNNGAGLTGTGEAGSTITLTKPDGSEETTEVAPDGSWSFAPNPLADGEEGTVTATDPSGNTSGEVSTGVADTVAPDVPVVDSNNGDGLAGTGEPGTTITVTKPDGSEETTVVDEDGNWSFAPNPLDEGEEGTVTATDPSGNTSGEVTTGVADIIAPDAPVVENNNGISLAGTGEVGSTITLTKPDGSEETTVVDGNGNWSFAPNPLGNGEEGTITATDPSGNTSGEADTGAASYDQPSTPLVETNNAAGLTGTGDVGNTITLTDADGNVIDTTVVDGSGNWSFAPNPLTNGQEGTLTATDGLGTDSNRVTTGIADTVAPDAPVIDSNNGAGLTGTGEAGSTITLTDADGTVIDTVVVDGDGNWSFAPNPLTDGQEGKVTATDPSGNTSGETNTGVTDITAPDAPVVESNNNEGLTGTGEAGSTITLTDTDGNVIDTTVADEDGNWSFAPNPLADGEEGKVTATDPSGNTSGETTTGAADTVAPDAPIVDSNNSEGLTGTGEAGSTITLTDTDGTVIDTVVVDEEGNWSFAPNPLADGEEGKVTATDPSGNTSGETNTGVTDITAPDAPVVESNNNEGLTGTGEAGSTIALTDTDGNVIDTTVADEEGNWSFAPNPLADGEEGKVTATDPSGNTSGETTTGVADTVAPDAPIVDSNNSEGLTGTGEAGSTITLTDTDGTVIDTVVVDEEGNWSFAPNPLADGEEGKVTATDPSGNTSGETTTGVADTVAPDAPIVDSNNSEGLTGTGEAGSTITLTDTDGNVIDTTVVDEEGNWSFAPNPLADGEEGKVTATDPSGNTSGETTTGVTDITAPDAPVVDSNNNEGLTGTGEAGSTITLTDADGTVIDTVVVDGDGNWSFAPNPLADGQEGKVTATDEAGNTSSETTTGVADLTAPDAPIVDSNNSEGLTGTGEAGSTITLTDADGTVIDTVVVDGDGNWSFTPNPLTDGQEGKVTATDEAGNTSGETSTGITDLTAPDAPIVDSNNSEGLTGTGEIGSTITLTDTDGNVIDTTVVDGDGNWSFTPNPLADGQEGKVTATDEAGNVSGETTTGITDITAPDAPVVENNNGISLAGTGEVGSTITLTKPDGSEETTVVDGNGNWSFAPNPLGNGEEGTITATDPSGNTSGEADTGAASYDQPSTPLVETNNAAGLTGTGDVGNTITLTDADGNVIDTTVVDGSGNWSFAPNPLTNGQEGTLTATDGLGTDSNRVTTGIADTVAPDAPVIDSNNGAGLTGTGEAGSTITLTDADGTVIDTVVVDEEGNWSFAPNPLTDGQEGKVTATDPSGNTSGETTTGVADIIAPDAPVIDSNNGAGLTGTGEAGSTITLTDADGTVIDTVVVDGDGNWSFTPNPLTDGQEGKVTATDEAGNTSSETTTGVADTVAPDAPIVDSNNSEGLTGTGEAGSTITLTDTDGTVIDTVVVDEEGNWSFAPNPLADGEEGKVTATDPSGNTSGETNTGVTDITAPDAPVVESNNNEGLTGTGEAGSTIALTDTDGNVIDTTVADEEGNWSFAPNPLADGEEGKVTATDPSGNTSGETTTGVADTVAPDAPIVDSNNSEGLTGTGEAGSTITLTDTDGTVIDTVVVDEEGNWSFAPNPLADGEEGKVTATDPSGNTSGETTTGVADTVAPDAPIVDSNNSEGLTGTGEAGSTITLTDTDGNVIDTTVVDEEGNWSFAPNPLADGEEGKVTATDPSGNTSGETTTGVTDITAPDAPVVDSNNNEGLTGTGEAGSTITLTDADGTVIDTVVVDGDGNWSFAPNPLADGQEGKVTATDEAGNTSSETTTGVADLTAPDAPIVDSNNSEGLTGTGEAGSTITLTDADGTVIDTVVVDGDGNWSFTPNPLTDGQEGKVTATDEAGNTSGETSTGITDLTAPDAPIVDSNNSEGLTGTGEIGSTITLTDTDGNVIDTTVVDGDGNWSFTPNPLADGQEGKVTATDEAGNVSGETTTGITDITAPDAPVVENNNGISLAGTGEVGSTITLTKPDGSEETTVVDGNGNWSFAPNPLGNGEEGTITATDPSGNTSGEADTGAASYDQPSTPLVETNNAAGLTGTGDVGNTITLTDADGNVIDTTVVDGSGNWSFAPNPLTNGQEGTLTATDGLGTDSNRVTTGIADTVAPDAPVIDSNNGAGLTGTGEAGSTITLTDADGTVIDTVVVDEEGNWSFAPNPLTDGQEGKVTATDPSGNTSGETTTGVADIIAPDAPVIDSNNGAGLTGTGEAGSTITLTDADGTVIDTVVVDGDGNWSFTPNPLTDGQEGKVTATDEAGNTSSETTTGVADITAPDAPIVDSNNSEGLTGTGEAGSTITLTDADGTVIDTVVVDGDGNWSFAPNPLTDGQEGKVTATDEAGNTSSETTTGVADITAPDAPVIDSNNGAGLTGTGEAGSTITLTDADGTVIDTVVVDGDGNWSFAPNPLTDGQEGKVTATDPSGNTSGETTTGVADIIAPDAPVIDSNNGAGLTGTGEAGSTITLTDADGTVIDTVVVDGDGNWSFTPNPLTDGQEGKVTATDEAGNTSSETTTGVADITAPDAPVIDSNNGAGLTGTGEAGSTITLTDVDGTVIDTVVVDGDGNWSFAPNPLTDGQEGKVTATDEAGNTSSETTTGVADITAPDAPIVDSNNGSGLTGTGEAGSTITLTKPDGSEETTEVAPDGSWSFAPNPLADGEEGKVTATDPSGNTSSETTTGVADITAPDAPVIDSNNGAGLTGTGEAGSTITLTDADGTVIDTVVVDEEGNWSFAPNPLTDGQEGKVTATDPSGNTSGETTTGVADITAPDAPVIDSNNGAGLTGTGEAGSTITLTDADGTVIDTVVVDGDGNWSFAPNPLTDGQEGKVTATDEAGNTSSETTTGVADITAPDAPIVDSNNSEGLTGTGEAGSTITLTDADGTVIDTVVVDGDGNWSFAPNPLTDGQEGKVTATDEAGNTSSETTTGVADITAPDAPIVDSNNSEGLTGTGEAGSTITLTDADGTVIDTVVVDGDGNWSFAPNPLTDGQEGKVTATDEAGNTSSETTTGVADITAPDAPIVESNNGSGLTGTGEAGSTITLTDSDGNVVDTTVVDGDGNWSFAPNPLTDDQEGKVTATDPSGNTSGETSTGVADITAPDAPIVENNNGSGLTGTGEAGSTITLTDSDGNVVDTTVVDEEGNWSFAPNPLTDGEEGKVTATDPSGNTSGETSTGVTDITAPDAPIVENNNGEGLTGKGEAGSTITLTDTDGNVIDTTVVDEEGNWSFAPNPLADGEEGKVTATDPSGNTSGETTTGTADVTAPDAPVVENNNGAGLTGTGEAGSTITLTDADGNVVDTTVVDEEGNWSFAPNPLADGEEGKVTATDPSGNTSGETSTGVTDITAPDAPIVDSNNSEGLTGTGEAGSTITLTDTDGNVIDTTVVDGDGNWSFAPNPLADGEEGKVTATDPSGNTSGETITGVADLTAPDAPIVDSNNSEGLTGKGEVGSTITLTDTDGNVIDTTVVGGDGNWSFAPNPLADGQEGEVTATDEAGNISGETNTGVADLTAPDAPIIDSNNSEGLTGTGEAGSTITLTKPDGSEETTVVDENGNWSFAPNPLIDGEEGKVTATDEAGNISGETNTGITDAVAPDAPIISNVMDDHAPVTGEVDNNGHTNDKTPTINGTAEANSTVIIYNGAEQLGTALVDGDGNWSFTPTTDLVDGTYTLSVVAVDAAGNESGASNDFTITVDTSMPVANTITIDSITEDMGVSSSDFVTNDNTLIFSGSLSSALQANEQIEISLDGGLTWVSVITAGTAWSYDHTGSVLADGNYDVEVRISTLAGNTGASANQEVVVDTVGDVSVEGLTSSFAITTDTSNGLSTLSNDSHSSTATNSDLVTRDQTLTLSGTLTGALDSGDFLQISNDKGLTWTTLTLTGLNWSYALPEFESSASTTYQLRVIDTAGNIATNTGFNEAGYTVVVDLDSPEGIAVAPIVPESVNTATVYTYDSASYGKVEAGATVSLVNDVDGDGVYREGLDKIIGFATADSEGNWSINTKLPAGSSNLGFVVWDDAGNRSGMSSSTSVGTTTGVGYVEKTQTWGTTDTGFYGINVASATLQGGQWVFYQTPDSTGYASTWNNGSLYFMKDTVNGPATYDYIYLSGGVAEAGYGAFLSGATMFDINRDGLIDVIGAKSGYGAPYKTSSWLQNADGSFTAVQVNTPNGFYQHLGGTIALDITGDGYVDIFMSTSETSVAGVNHIFTMLENKNGTLTLNNKLPTGANANLTMLHEVSGVDLNNDGTVDIVGHSNRLANGTYNNLGTSLTVLHNNGAGLSGVTHYDNVFQNNGYIDYGDQIANMVWADFNGDGYLDLFLGLGNKGTVASSESRIYLNDGNGGLLTSVGDAKWFGDSQDAAASLAVDWNHDGKMDIIELSRSRLTASPTLYLNTGNNVWNQADQKYSIASAGSYTGAIAVDYNWDGNVDLILYTANKTVLVENTNAVADGTSLNVSIVDGNGVNVFFGNTVHLYDSKGNLVATQIVNAQSSGTNISSGLLNFYGLDANETYSLQMLRITNGVANHIGMGENLGGYTEGTINSSWGNITTGKANENLVLTVENDGAANHSLGNGITGTGYNDTFFATEGDDIYNGGGGWNNSLTGQKIWSADAGLDTVDYSNATQGINADLSTGIATGMGTDKLVSIEGLIGSAHNDVFRDNAANNVFEGKGGDDTFHLTAGGNDTLLYKLLDAADATGGNGSDAVHGFHVGAIGSDTNADVIDIRELLDYKGVVSFYTDEGVMKLDYNSKGVLDYIKAEVVDGNTVISIDRDGAGGSHEFTTVITLNNTETDLLTLLSNSQIII